MNEKNHRIIRNSFALYLRMAINLAIGLYTSRVVLNVLGVSDYGVYGVVGGVISFMGFINASMTSATSRFLNYAIGEGDDLQCKKTFSTAVLSHIFIALVILVVGETIGLWFVTNKLVIPEERTAAALWVYHLSLVSVCIGLSFIPYTSTIVAHEKMNFFAFFEIFKSSLNLAIVFILMFVTFDKLILYAALGLAVQLICSTIVWRYTTRIFSETKSIRHTDKGIFKKMFSFLSQTIFAHLSFSFRLNGNNVALNMFFGTVANAANGIAMTVQGVLLQFSSNINLAFTPQIIQEYSRAEYSRMNKLMVTGSRLSVLVVLLFIIPLWIEMPEVLRMWLKIVPDYAVVFSRIILLTVVMSAITSPVYTGLTATGDIKKYSLFQGLVYFAVPFVFYFMARQYGWAELAYVLVVISQIFTASYLFVLMRRKVSGFSLRFFAKNYLVIFITAAISFSLAFIVSISLTSGPIRVVAVTLTAMTSLALCNYFLLTKSEKSAFVSLFHRR